MTQTERTTRLIELGYFGFFGLDTDVPAALDAVDAAARIDFGSAPPVITLPWSGWHHSDHRPHFLRED